MNYRHQMYQATRSEQDYEETLSGFQEEPMSESPDVLDTYLIVHDGAYRWNRFFLLEMIPLRRHFDDEMELKCFFSLHCNINLTPVLCDKTTPVTNSLYSLLS